MKRKILLSHALCAVLSLFAETQTGSVRTLARPNSSAKQLPGVTLRVRGSHNAVASDTDGRFSMLLPALKNGDAFVLNSVFKSGYELRDPELLGRPLAFSTTVPLELVMVSQQQLLEEKQRIEQKAREQLEAYYEKQLTELQSQLSAARLSNEQYEQQLSELEGRYEQMEPMLATMADRYARTDYAQLDSLAQQINGAIETGNIDEAERLIHAKGALADREAKVREAQQMVVANTTDLAADLFHLHSIALVRFRPDSAAFYLTRRADVDSTNVTYQLDLIKFLHEGRYPIEQATPYLDRVARHMRVADQQTHTMLLYLNELAFQANALQHFEEAISLYKQAVALAEQLYGHDTKLVAGRLTSMGAVYLAMKNDKEARRCLEQAIRIYQMPDQTDVETQAIAENNLGNVYYRLGKPDKALQHFTEAYQLLQAGKPTKAMVHCMMNIGTLHSRAGRADEARDWWQRALPLSEQLYGTDNPVTRKLRKNLN